MTGTQFYYIFNLLMVTFKKTKKRSAHIWVHLFGEIFFLCGPYIGGQRNQWGKYFFFGVVLIQEIFFNTKKCKSASPTLRSLRSLRATGLRPVAWASLGLQHRCECIIKIPLRGWRAWKNWFFIITIFLPPAIFWSIRSEKRSKNSSSQKNCYDKKSVFPRPSTTQRNFYNPFTQVL